MHDPVDWHVVRDFALSLNLPEVIETTAWDHPCLKANGKLWVWWSPKHGAPVFKLPREDRDFLLEMAPERFFTTPHHRPHAMILMRPEAFDADWAKVNLIRSWREQAPKRWLKAWDAAHPQA